MLAADNPILVFANYIPATVALAPENLPICVS